jgi:uncharacterized protein (DUF927 family)
VKDLAFSTEIRVVKKDDLPADAQQFAAIPADLERPAFSLAYSSLVAVYDYAHADGSSAFVVARFQTSRGKTYMQYTAWQLADGQRVWAAAGYSAQRPLYNLPALEQSSEKPVLLVEGEKCVDASQQWARFAVTTWAGGANGMSRTDFTPLSQREVIICPDDDEPGHQAGNWLADHLVGLGARVMIFDTAQLAEAFAGNPHSGFDIADAIDAGLHEGQFAAMVANSAVCTKYAGNDIAELASENDEEITPQRQVYQEIEAAFGIAPDVHERFDLSVDGVTTWKTDKKGALVRIFVSSPLVVLGRTRLSGPRGGWGYHIGLRNCLGQWETLTIPAKLLANDGKELRELLAEAGAITPQEFAGRRALMEYISYAQNCPVITLASRPGWLGDAFALPNGIISPGDGDNGSNVTLDMGGRDHLLNRNGTLEAWKELAALAAPNTRATFALCCAFAPPMLRHLKMKGGAFHFFGNSSRGKTTLLRLAGSVWGGGGEEGFVRNWNNTSNGAEGMIADHNDLLLPLDELTVAAPELASQLIYMLANGQGKGRARKDGSAAERNSWNALVLSSGEKTAAQQITQGRHKSQMTGGLAVRMVDVPIEHAPGETIEDTCGLGSSRAWVERVRCLTDDHYGLAGPAFVQKFCVERSAHIAQAHRYIERVQEMLFENGDDPQVQRAAERFALVTAAGQLASDWGIIPISHAQILRAITACYHGWKTQRGGGESEESRQALRHLKHFFEAHGPSRFERLLRGGAAEDSTDERTDEFPVRDRCGYRVKQEDDAWLYYVLPGAWEEVICAEHSPQLAAKVADEAGALIKGGEAQRLQKKVRLPDFPNGTRVYAIRPDLL